MPRNGNPKPWIEKAEQDYGAATALARRRKRPMPDVVCFHAQQCAEKYLKAFLVSRRIYFPKTHDLVELLNLARPHGPTLELLKPALVSLNPYAVAFRYPDEHATPTDVRRAMAAIRLVRERLQQFLKVHP